MVSEPLVNNGFHKLTQYATITGVERAVLATLAYADIFDYPLTLAQIHQFLIGQKAQFADVKKTVERLAADSKIEKHFNFYHLPKRGQIVGIRRQRAKFYPEKITTARRSARLLQFLPQINLIGVSGGLAVANANCEDDIDFFIITATSRLWTGRLLATALLSLFGRRRTPESKKLTNKICLNMFIDEKKMEITPHDLYLAHEVLQMQPIFVRGNTYQRFLAANSWAYQFLPNWRKTKPIVNGEGWLRSKSFSLSTPSLYLETLARRFQLNYMVKRRTIEKITPTKLQFHPQDVHHQVLKIYLQKLKELNLSP